MTDSSKKTVCTAGRGRKKGGGSSGERARVPDEVKELLKAATPEAIRLFIDTIQNPDVKIELRLDCAKTIMDRVYGKATQPIDGDLPGVIQVVLGELEEYAD